MQAKQDILNTTQIYLNLLNPEGGLSEGEIGNSVFNKVQSFKKKKLYPSTKRCKKFQFYWVAKGEIEAIKKRGTATICT